MQVSAKFYYFTLINCVLLSNRVHTRTKFTNIKCNSLDKKFADFDKCRLSVPSRGVIALTVDVKVFQVPVTNISINLALFKKATGFRPFLYNVTVDFCDFMANKKRYPFVNIFVNIFIKQSNINHTCPFNHELIVKNLILRDEMFDRMPVPEGEYLFKLMVAAYNDWKADVGVYFTRE
ncbi:PREDICTED: uncharacterized protein LOC108967098 [Bactrocera latifrons]|uniref:uncharacterized protein LOC108967098 n=1 Tax=Bactrocera latifrons TaxID=174628 RepID=UPI0008DE5B29|nr:PREDICTED: uncharacterized protein LOC108967098 [Bactrocera latifrons]